MAAQRGNVPAGAKLVGLCFIIDQSIGHGDAQSDLRNLLALCSQLKYTQEKVQQLLAEVAESYGRDRGASLVAEAFGDSGVE